MSTLVLGTHPSLKSLGGPLTAEEVRLRGGSGAQNYGMCCVRMYISWIL